MKSVTSRVLAVCALGALFVSLGCSSTAKLDYLKQGSAVASTAARRPTKVALVVDPALASFVYELKFGGGGKAYPFGEALAQYAIQSAKQVFQDVQEYPSASAASGKADVILVPSVSACDITICVGASGVRHMLVSVEWLIMDHDNRFPIWLETASGTASQKNGMTGGRERKMIQAGFESLTAETVKLLQTVPTVERMAGR